MSHHRSRVKVNTIPLDIIIVALVALVAVFVILRQPGESSADASQDNLVGEGAQTPKVCNNDGLKNHSETKIDCGAKSKSGCGKCAADTCSGNANCANNICTGRPKKCSTTCQYGMANRICGQYCASKCDDGLACVKNMDCSSGLCEGGVCKSPCTPKTCSDLQLLNQCGSSISDGCGGIITCYCPSGQVCAGGVCITCGGSGQDCCPSGLNGGCHAGLSCQSGVCQAVCIPNCVNKACGSDGCGGSCGSCVAPQSCNAAGQCICTSACAGKQCGDNGCGGSCGTCALGTTCSAGSCVPCNNANACTTNGAQRCNGNSHERCGDSNGDNCLEWVAEACQTGFMCDSNTGSCVSSCTRAAGCGVDCVALCYGAQSCLVNADCRSGVCTSGVCACVQASDCKVAACFRNTDCANSGSTCIGGAGGSEGTCNPVCSDGACNVVAPKGYHDPAYTAQDACKTVVGWTCDENSWLSKVNVKIFADGDGTIAYGRMIYEGPADQISNVPRDAWDISMACGNPSPAGSNGAHRFIKTIPSWLWDGDKHFIYTMAQDILAPGVNGAGYSCLGPNTQVPGCGPTITCGSGGVPVDGSLVQIEGDFDAADCTTLAGWACDKIAGHTNRQFIVEIWDGDKRTTGTKVATVVANQGESGGCPAGVSHSFSISTPAVLKNGVAHSLYAYAVSTIGAYYPLYLSPKPLTCAAGAAAKAGTTARRK